MRNILLLTFVLFIVKSCKGQDSNNIKNINMNKLVYSSSPYLQQHADNPEHRKERGEEKNKKNKKKHKEK